MFTDDIKNFVINNKNKLIVAILIILIVLIIVSVISYTNTKESFGKLQRIKLLAEAANKVEGFNGPRTDMMFKGQFDYLMPKASVQQVQQQVQQVQQQVQQIQQIQQQPQINEPEQMQQIQQQIQQVEQQIQQIQQQVNKQSVSDATQLQQQLNQVKQQVQEAQQKQQQVQQKVQQQITQQQITQQIAQPVLEQSQQLATQQPTQGLGQQMKRQIVQQVQQRIQPQAVQNPVVLQTQNTYDGNQMLDDQRDVQSNSGNSLQSQSAETFAHSRIYRQFGNILGGIEASEEAQKADQVQTSVEMKAMQSML